MSFEISNKLRGFSTIRVTDDTVTVNLSDLTANANVETVVGAVITSLKWSVQPTTGSLQISRTANGSNAVVVANLFQTGFWSHDELAIANTPNGNITIACATGTTLLTVRKDATYNTDVGIF